MILDQGSTLNRQHTYFQMLSSGFIRSPLRELVTATERVIPSLYGHHTAVRWDLVIIVNMKGDYDMSGKVIPKPNVEHCDWLNEMSVIPNKINLRDYRDHSGPDARIWLMEGANRITEAMKTGILSAELETINDQKVNCFGMTPDAKRWWKNGKKQGMSPQEVLDGWVAMQTMSDELKGDEGTE